ncbi:hypothetical protein [Candidatus Williamhamiltonella defendens]|uniref:hypothetical protein n=1 Tax=Candidatus Williamhamiltonella defendens TaxID=138072 RepID=UPI0016515DDC|nr:hypothetical protein [Candidatus Hamiltonella defensa]
MRPYKLFIYNNWNETLLSLHYLTEIKDKFYPKEVNQFIADNVHQHKDIEIKDSEYHYPEHSALTIVNGK